MNHRILIFGASGAGTTTLGSELSLRLGAKHLDCDTYYWKSTNPPYAEKRTPRARVAMLLRDIKGVDNWVLSGSLCSWGDPIFPKLNLAVLLRLESRIRIERLRNRERSRFGARIMPGGDMYDHHQAFVGWAKSYDQAQAPVRSLDLHNSWKKKLACPVMELYSTDSVEKLCASVLESFDA